uniref:Uncharacterized protein n=1 Tax=Rhizophora mucronata TaxID=61149 RepID=A0A2P2KSB7_RHIMU
MLFFTFPFTFLKIAFLKRNSADLNGSHFII